LFDWALHADPCCQKSDKKVISPHRRFRLFCHRSKDRWILAGLILLPVIVFARVLPGPFLNWDDWQMVWSNLDLRPDHWPAIVAYWYHPHLRLFIPLTYSLYAFLATLSEIFTGALQPWWFHAANLLIHLWTGVILWRLLTRLSRDPLAGGIGAGLFLIHPLQVETVAWISSLNTLLAGLFVTLTLWLYVRSIDATRARQNRAYFAAACAAAELAMLAKPSACGLPLMALAIHLLLSRRDLKRAMLRAVILGAVQAPCALIAHYAQTSKMQFADPFARRPLVALDAIGFYIMKLFVPIHLAIDYGRIPSHLTPGLPLAVGAICLLLLSLALCLAAFKKIGRRCSWLLAGGLIFIAGLLPVLGLVPFDFQNYSTVADRYVYLAMIGPAIVMTGLLRPLFARDLKMIVAAFMLVLLAVISFVQAGVWTSDGRLFRQALAVNPNSIAANQTLGFLAAQAAEQSDGDPQRQNQLIALALDHDGRALAVSPAKAEVHFNRGNLLLQTGHPAQAAADYAAAAGQLEDESRLQNNWGIACMQLNRFSEAIEHFRLATQADPTFADAFANAGTAYLHAGRPDLASEFFHRALSLDPNQPQAASGLNRVRVLPE
jgi:tetratricopeptide (TPR) repeat protein